MGTHSLLSLSYFLFLFQIFYRCALAQKTAEVTLPHATFNNDNKTWMVTVPEVWNFTTILEVTGNGSIVTDPQGTVDNLQLPYPGFEVTPSSYLDGDFSRYTPLVYVNGTFSRYATNALNYGLQQDLNTSVAAYSDNTWVIPITCEWPISGQYSRLNRVLYYVLLVFALVVHHHEWLVAGALASAAIYSGSAAVQAIAQFVVINLKKPRDNLGDNDNEAIMGILAAGLLMAVPLINWSRTLRRLQARPILIYWAIIIFIGYLFVIIGQKETQYSDGWDREDGGMMTCNTREAIPDFQNLGFIDHSFITKYNCDDPCYNPKQQHPFHDVSSVISRVDCSQFTWTDTTGTAFACFLQCPRDISDTCYLGHDGWDRRDFILNNVGYYAILPVAAFELFFVLCFGRRSPEEIRDIVFRFLVSRNMIGDYRAMPAEKRRWASKSIRVRLAQASALFFYIFALCTYLVCLPFFVFSIIWQERLMRFFPDSEAYREASQWLPWVGVGLTLGAAIVGRYHHSWHVHVRHLFFGRRDSQGMRVAKVKRRSINFGHWLRKKTWRTGSRLWMEWCDLKEFVRSPFFLVLDEERERTRDHPSVKFSFAGSLPYPGDEERNSKENYQGPWIKDDETWSQFPIEFHVEADNRTLQSWERYQSSAKGVDERIIYSVLIPPVPTYPDRRTVIAKANASHVEEKLTVSESVSQRAPDVTRALVPGARKQSTVAYSLQAINTFSDSESTKQNSCENSLHKTETVRSNEDAMRRPERREQINQTPEPSHVPRDYTPTPSAKGGPLNSHHLRGAGRTSPLANHTEVEAAAEADLAFSFVGQAH